MKIFNCPLCSDFNYKNIQTYNKLINNSRIVMCCSCKHYFTLIEDDINFEKLYEEGVYKVVENRGAIFDKLLTIEGWGIINSIFEKSEKKNGRLLDFGCGKGKFLDLAQKKGFDVMGIETSFNRAKYAKEVYKLKIETSYYSSGEVDSVKFDFITLFHVLEHLQSPVEILKNLVTANLNKDGLLVIEVPNIESFQSVLAKQNWIHLDIPKHLSHFTYSALYTMLHKLGFSVIKKEYFSIQHGVLGMLDSLMKIFGFKKHLIFELKNNLGGFLLIKVVLLFPLAFIFELVAALFNKGGIIRIYAKSLLSKS